MGLQIRTTVGGARRMPKQIRLLIISALELIEIIKFYEYAKSA